MEGVGVRVRWSVLNDGMKYKLTKFLLFSTFRNHFFYFLFLQEKPFFIVKLSSFFEKKDIDQFNIKITEKHNHVAIIELHNSVLIKYKSAD